MPPIPPNAAEIRAQKIEWIERTTKYLMRLYGAKRELAAFAALLGSYWIEDFATLSENRPDQSQNDIMRFVYRSRASSERKAAKYYRFPTGVAMKNIRRMATTAFCTPFPKEQQLFIMDNLRKGF
jgi:hypothetical protein